MKVLIIRLSAIGDTIHGLPVAATLKAGIPDVKVGWMVEPASAPLLRGNPCVDEVLELPRKVWLSTIRNPLKWKATITEAGAFWSAVRARKYDVAIDLQGLLKSSVCAISAGARQRFGFAGTREGAEFLLTDRLDVGDYFAPSRHVVEHNLTLARHVCHRLTGVNPGSSSNIEFPLPVVPEDISLKIDQLLGAGDENTGPDKSMVRNVVLIPGTTWISKVWPADNWCRLAVRLARDDGFAVSLVGGHNEIDVNARLAARLYKEAPGLRVFDLTGRTSLMDLVCLFGRSSLVVGADTGPLHLAAAVGRAKVVGIYGSTPWQRNGPWGSHCLSISQSLWCQPCFSKVCPLSTVACLKDLTADAVYGQLKKFIAGEISGSGAD